MRVTVNTSVKHATAGEINVAITATDPSDVAMRQIFDALSKFGTSLSDRTQSTMPFRVETDDLLGDFPAPAPAEKTLGDRRVELYLSTCNAWMFETPMNAQQLKLEKLLDECSHSKPETPRIAVDALIHCIDEALKEPT